MPCIVTIISTWIRRSAEIRPVRDLIELLLGAPLPDPA
jgi:hypothetical protein